MIHRIVLPAALAAVLLFSCTKFFITSAPQAKFPVVNEKIFIYPIIDSSSIDSFPGWPSEKAMQTVLLDNFLKLHRAMVMEFRQREKYGLYETVEDSSKAGVRLSFVIGHYQFTKDTLTFPVRMTMHRLNGNISESILMTCSGKYRAKSRPKSDVHYLDILLADFQRYFPYRKISGLFYRH
jgi:hypothetical protein